MKRIASVVVALILVFLAAGCAGETDTYLYTGRDGDWSIGIPKEFSQDKEEYDEQMKSHTVTFKTESEFVLVINEIIDEKLEINEDTLKEELSMDNLFHVERFDTIDIQGVGKAYGALVSDEVTKMTMMYHRLKYKDKAISFIFHGKNGFSVEQEAEAKAIISTFKDKK